MNEAIRNFQSELTALAVICVKIAKEREKETATEVSPGGEGGLGMGHYGRWLCRVYLYRVHARFVTRELLPWTISREVTYVDTSAVNEVYIASSSEADRFNGFGNPLSVRVEKRW